MATRVTVNTATLLHWQASDRATGLFPQVKIYADDWTLLATVNLTDRGNGNYSATYTPTLTGKQAADYSAYTDSGHTTLSTSYTAASELLDVQSTDVSAIKTETAAIKERTDNLPDDPASTTDVAMAGAAAALAVGGTGGPLQVNTIAELGRVLLNRNRIDRATEQFRIYNDDGTTVRYRRVFRAQDGTDGTAGTASIGNLQTSDVHGQGAATP